MWRALSAGTLFLVGGCSQSVVTNPSWAAMPTPEQFEASFPLFAAEAGLPGQATLSCVARTDGRLDLCRAIRVTPKGLGYDRAMLSLISEYRVNPQSVDGQLQKSRVEFTQRFRIPDEAEPPSWTGPEPSAERLEAAAALVTAMQMEAPVRDELSLGVDADRVERVRSILAQVDQEFADRVRDANILALARVLTPEQAAYLMTREGPRPPRPDPVDFDAAGDELWRTGMESSARIRSLYCAEFDCRPPPFLAEETPAP